LLTALFGGAAAAFAVSYVLNEPVTGMWAIGLFWALTLANIDRLLLLITASRNRLLAMLPRLAISALLGFLIAEPLTLRIFQPEINAQIATAQERSQSVQLAGILSTYQPRITADDNRAARLTQQLDNRQSAINEYKFKADCEAQETNCSTTHRLGCGPYCLHYKQLVATKEQEYAAIAPRTRSQIAAALADARTLGNREAAAEKTVQVAIAASGGWAARKRALGQLEAQDSGVRETVWLVRLAFVLVDLAPLIVKFLLVLFGKSVYDEIAAADKDRERVAAHRLRELARLERAKVTRRADAEDEVDEVVVDTDKEQRIAAACGDATVPGGGKRDPRGTRGAPIQALSLTDFVAGSKIHERMAVPIVRALAQVAWIGTALLVALAGGLFVIHLAGYAAVTGGWIGLPALPAALALAIYTRGFRSGPAWAHRAAFGTALMGLALPAVIIALNV
jgi:hypothetical protein